MIIMREDLKNLVRSEQLVGLSGVAYGSLDLGEGDTITLDIRDKKGKSLKVITLLGSELESYYSEKKEEDGYVDRMAAIEKDTKAKRLKVAFYSVMSILLFSIIVCIAIIGIILK